MEITDKDIDGIRNFQVKRCIIDLQKDFLVLLEDLVAEQDQYIKVMNEYFDNEDSLLENFNPLKEAKMERLRKKVLDSGGQCVRAVLDKLEE